MTWLPLARAADQRRNPCRRGCDRSNGQKSLPEATGTLLPTAPFPGSPRFPDAGSSGILPLRAGRGRYDVRWHAGSRALQPPAHSDKERAGPTTPPAGRSLPRPVGLRPDGGPIHGLPLPVLRRKNVGGEGAAVDDRVEYAVPPPIDSPVVWCFACVHEAVLHRFGDLNVGSPRGVILRRQCAPCVRRIT